MYLVFSGGITTVIQMNSLKFYLNIVVGVFALLAGILWLVSTIVKVKAPEESSGYSFGLGGGGGGLLLQIDGVDLVATAAAQAKWNRAAALAASISAFAQAGLLCV
ncbi:hypothetical protein [Luteolibacter soli]|uniref:Uncharacterized protein n=1 Tax=Luteolibacter soli TaxID=3135280 RepID=A0ABU9B1J7_9BACT